VRTGVEELAERAGLGLTGNPVPLRPTKPSAT
jgi:hypothetical protein